MVVVGQDRGIENPLGRQVPDFLVTRIYGGRISMGTKLVTQGAVHDEMTVNNVMWMDPVANTAVIQCVGTQRRICLQVPFRAIYWEATPFEIPNQ